LPFHKCIRCDLLVGIQAVNIVSILGGTYGSREREISSNDAIFKSYKPESISPELKQVALLDDFNLKNGSYPRYSVAVWRTPDPQTGETIYWVGVERYWSALEEFVDYHFTDDVFYHDGWKKHVAPECRGK
jgi:hypothetical protein